VEGVEQFRAVLVATYGDRQFTAEDIMTDVERPSWPPATQRYARQRSVVNSIGHHLYAMNGLEIVSKCRGGRTRTIWRLASG
jgi:hypothetical protein